MADSTSLILYDPRTADPEVIALAGFLAGYAGRPPRGEQDEVAAEAVCRASVRTIGWSANLERHLDDPEALANQVRPGAIILVHDGQGDGTRSVEAVDRFLTVLDDRGVRAVGVDELLAGAACSPSHRTTGCGT